MTDSSLTRATTICEIVASVAEIAVSKVSMTTPLSDIGIDSLDRLILAERIEAEFDVIISDADLSRIDTANDILKVLQVLMKC